MKLPPKLRGQKSLAAPDAAASKDDYRHTITSPILRAGYLLATDSYIAVKLPVEVEPGDVDGPVPNAALAAARKFADGQLALEDRHAKVVAKDKTVTLYARPTISDFPDIEKLFPELSTHRMCFSVEKLARVARALGTDIVLITPQAQVNAPIVVQAEGCKDDRIGLVMPYRQSTEEGHWQWVKATPAVKVDTRLSPKTHPNRKGRVTEVHDDHVLVYWYDTRRTTSVGTQRLKRYNIQGGPQ